MVSSHQYSGCPKMLRRGSPSPNDGVDGATGALISGGTGALLVDAGALLVGACLLGVPCLRGAEGAGEETGAP